MKRYYNSFSLLSILLVFGGCQNKLSDERLESIFYEFQDSKIVCTQNYLGWSSEGAFFDLSVYKVREGKITDTLPDFDKFFGKSLSLNLNHIKWRKTPIDSISYKINDFTFTQLEFERNNCGKDFESYLYKKSSYFSYLNVSELEQYFFLYSTEKQEFYYLRRKGF